MYVTGQILKNIREDKGLQLQTIQDSTGIDQTLLSKIENGKRLPTMQQISALANVYDCDEKNLIVQCESDRLLKSMNHMDIAPEILKTAEDKITYGKQYIDTIQDTIFAQYISIENRRYIGSKAKLTDWIMKTIHTECPDADSLCDLFAGTAVVASKAVESFKKVIINDFLYVNNLIYKAFFEQGEWDEQKLSEIIYRYNNLDVAIISDNYFSLNFGDKYFDYNTARQIGYIRQDIEDLKSELTQKEYYILLASLIYASDRIANTVGHFDAYIKKPIRQQTLRIRMIDAKSCSNVEIHRCDANTLVRNISADVVYIDPPYNSRQYCSAYHLLDNLAKWEKPELKGVALKPLTMENKSAYCTNNATQAFADLIRNIKAKYVVISYNNMAQKGNGRSNAKIDDKDIMSVLQERGQVKIFAQNHKAFSTGKSNITDNQERLFVCKLN